MPFTAVEIAQHLDAEVLGDATLVIQGFAPADRARAGDLTFAENADYFARACESAASGIIVEGVQAAQAVPGKVLFRVKKARVAFAKALQLFFPEPAAAPGIHPTAIIDPGAKVDPTAHIGPYCVVGPHVVIGAGSALDGANHVGAGCRLGEGVRLFPRVTLYAGTVLGNRVRIHAGAVIGADGFGYVMEAGQHLKVPQVGNVIIHDDVEIGANVTVDRGALGPTVIGRGTKIDNLVQVAHNVIIGDHSLLIAQSGIAGSSKLGSYVVLAGQAGIAGHLRIGSQVTIGAQAGVMTNIPDGERWLGSPASPDRQAKRQMVATVQLPELLRRVTELERRLAAVAVGAGQAG